MSVRWNVQSNASCRLTLKIIPAARISLKFRFILLAQFLSVNRSYPWRYYEKNIIINFAFKISMSHVLTIVIPCAKLHNTNNVFLLCFIPIEFIHDIVRFIIIVAIMTLIMNICRRKCILSHPIFDEMTILGRSSLIFECSPNLLTLSNIWDSTWWSAWSYLFCVQLKKVFIFGACMRIINRATDALLLTIFWHALSNATSRLV